MEALPPSHWKTLKYFMALKRTFELFQTCSLKLKNERMDSESAFLKYMNFSLPASTLPLVMQLILYVLYTIYRGY